MADRTKHTCNGGAGPAFGRKTPGCPRCDELAAGARPRAWFRQNAAVFGRRCPCGHVDCPFCLAKPA